MCDIRYCPKCGKNYIGAPALSREDNSTLICPKCGTSEALDCAREVVGVNMDDEEFAEYKQDILDMIERSGKGE